jgi:tetratricopeptide (TPR) repeat protein
MKRWGLAGLALVFLVLYNGMQPDLSRFRTMNISETQNPEVKPKTEKEKKFVRELSKERYGPSLAWLDNVLRASGGAITDEYSPRLDARVLSSLMLAGLASGFKSQVANLLWMKSDEYWHKGLLTRQNPLMEMVVTLDPQFIEAWSTAGWHWAYNIYADIPTNPAYKDKPDLIRQKQQLAIKTGLSYLERGANMNPETYRLWFEWGWTRAEKAGLYDNETVELYKIARTKPDARTVETTEMVNGQAVPKKTEGKLDVVGNTIAHIYEKMPDIDKALDMWGRDLVQGKPQELALLRAAGEYWHRYGSDYTVIAQMYQGGDPVLKSRIKQIVPDVERLVAAQKMREEMQARQGTPTGAYITIAARYLPVWNLRKQGKYDQAIKMLIGVMNADPRYHLTQLPALGKILELRGDAPEAVEKQLKGLQEIEKSSAQDIGLHLLALLYEDSAKAAKDPKQKAAFNRLAYETWYRSRERDQLDFYALRKTRDYEDKFGYTAPKNIIDAIKKSRKSGTVEAAPEAPPNVQQYYQTPGAHGEGDGHDHDAAAPAAAA